MSTTLLTPASRDAATPRRWVAMPRARAIVGLVILVGLGLALGTSLLFARPYVPVDSEVAASAPTRAGSDARSGSQPIDPNC